MSDELYCSACGRWGDHLPETSEYPNRRANSSASAPCSLPYDYDLGDFVNRWLWSNPERKSGGMIWEPEQGADAIAMIRDYTGALRRERDAARTLIERIRAVACGEAQPPEEYIDDTDGLRWIWEQIENFKANSGGSR